MSNFKDDAIGAIKVQQQIFLDRVTAICELLDPIKVDRLFRKIIDREVELLAEIEDEFDENQK